MPGGLSQQTGVIIQPQQILFTGNKIPTTVAATQAQAQAQLSVANAQQQQQGQQQAPLVLQVDGAGDTSSEEDEDEDEDYDDEEEEDKEKDGEDGQVEEVIPLNPKKTLSASCDRGVGGMLRVVVHTSLELGLVTSPLPSVGATEQ